MIEIDFIDLLDRFNLALKRTLQRSVRENRILQAQDRA